MDFTKPIDKIAGRLKKGTPHLRIAKETDDKGEKIIKIFEKKYSRETGDLKVEEETIIKEADIQMFVDDLQERVDNMKSQFLP